MSEQKKPQAGEWWFANDGSGRVYIIGQTTADVSVYELKDGLVSRDSDWSNWHHEPRCTGWDWHPEPEPEWFDLTPFDQHTYRKCDEVFNPHENKWRKRHMANAVGALVFELKRIGYTQFRCLLKDAPPELVAMANKPEWPKYYTSNPPKDATIAYIVRESATDYKMMDYRGVLSPYTHHWNKFDDETRTEITKEQADSILAEKSPKPSPMPEQPKTETVTFHEVVIRDRYQMQLCWVAELDQCHIPTGRTETREVVR